MRVRVSLEDLHERLSLARASDQKNYSVRGVYDRYGQRDPNRTELLHRVLDDPAVGNVQRRGAWEQACGMPVLADPEQDQIEAWRTVEETLQFLLVERGCLRWVELTSHPVHTPYGYAGEQRLIGHAVVRVLMIGRHRPLVSEEN